MNEASVTALFLDDLRKAAPNAVIFKHADVGMKGLPDASMTWEGLTLWLEIKLHQPVRHGLWLGPEKALAMFQKAAPTQAKVCSRLERSGHCLYIIWRLKRADIYVVTPSGSLVYEAASRPDLVTWLRLHSCPLQNV